MLQTYELNVHVILGIFRTFILPGNITLTPFWRAYAKTLKEANINVENYAINLRSFFVDQIDKSIYMWNIQRLFPVQIFS